MKFEDLLSQTSGFRALSAFGLFITSHFDTQLSNRHRGFLAFSNRTNRFAVLPELRPFFNFLQQFIVPWKNLAPIPITPLAYSSQSVNHSVWPLFSHSHTFNLCRRRLFANRQLTPLPTANGGERETISQIRAIVSR